MKTNIQPHIPAFSLLNSRAASSVATNIVMKLKPETFYWKDESEYERFNIRSVKAGVVENGFIAQELEQVVPGAVAMTAERGPSGELFGANPDPYRCNSGTQRPNCCSGSITVTKKLNCNYSRRDLMGGGNIFFIL